MTWSRLFLCGLLALLCLPLGARAPAQPTSDLLNQAERRFNADDLPEAERLYLRALLSAGVEQRRTCYDRLLAVYDRRGRQDLAVKTGSDYERLLQQTGDRTRLRQLRVQMGECWFALGHWRSCETT